MLGRVLAHLNLLIIDINLLIGVPKVVILCGPGRRDQPEKHLGSLVIARSDRAQLLDLLFDLG